MQESAWSECVRVLRRVDRRMMMKLRGGTPGLEIEMRRWRDVAREEKCAKNVTVVKWKMWSIGR